MFSNRSEFSAEKNRLTLALAAKRAEGSEILDLTGSNPTQADFYYPEPEILAAIASRRSLVYQPAPRGLEDARLAIAEYYLQRGYQISPDDILLTASTSEAYSYLFKLLADPGDQICTPRPSYPLFDFLAWTESVEPVSYPLIYSGAWHVDIDGLRSQLSDKVRALLTVSPNNPTGSYLKADEWQEIRRLCLLRQVPVICDEVFHDYQLDLAQKAFEPLLERDVLVFVLNGLSKIAALPQLKLGWIVLAGPEKAKKQAFERLEMISDTFLSVATPVQLACRPLLASRLFVQRQIQGRVARNLRFLRKAFQGSTADCLHVEGGWYATLRLPRTRTEEEWVLHLLVAKNVLLHPGYFFDFYDEAYVVVSLITPEPVFTNAVLRLREACE